MRNVLNKFNPFYFPRDKQWEDKKHITLNWFKGYQMFDLHFWKPQKRYFTDGETSEKTILMIGATIFYFRIELFFDWAHSGPSWKK